MLLAVEGIWSGYGDISILQGVDLTVEAGEIVAVLGPNGVGKTTLMRTLAGALHSQRGRISFCDADITRTVSHERAKIGIGYVPQGREIFSQLTVLENLLVGLYAANMNRERVDQILEEFPSLKPKLKHLGGSLSGGQQQLLALARALIIEPKILLLDEPSEGIQPSLLDEISEVLCQFREKIGLSVLLVEQNLDFASAMADRAYLMDIGRINRQINATDLREDSSLQREFLGAEG